MERIKVLIVDDQIILLDGLKAVLETDINITVIGLAENGYKAIEFIKKQKPDVVLLDIRMPEMNGVDCVKLIKQENRDIAVLMLTTFDDEQYIKDALKNGACGYLLKDISGEKLISSVKDAANGDTILPAKIAARLISNINNYEDNEKGDKGKDKLKKEYGFTDREIEIAAVMIQGFTNRQISNMLFISEGTVKNYISMIYEKLSVNDRTAAVLKVKEYL